MKTITRVFNESLWLRSPSEELGTGFFKWCSAGIFSVICNNIWQNYAIISHSSSKLPFQDLILLCKNELVVKHPWECPWRIILSYYLLWLVRKMSRYKLVMRFAQGCLESQWQNPEENSSLMTPSPSPASFLFLDTVQRLVACEPN